MGRRRQRGELVVRMNGDLVGRLASEPSGRLRFTYDGAWLASERRTPISHSLPLSGAAYADARVESFFDNLLPDAEPIRARMQRALGAASTRVFDLLEVAGRDCVGALQLLPDEAPIDVRRIDAEPIDEHGIAEILRALPAAPLGLARDDDFRMSIAGTHDKTGLLRHAGAWHRPRGATPTSHLLKPPIGPTGRGRPDLSDSVETEWLTTRLAGALGLPVANVEIARFEEEKALVVERFDRRWSSDGSWLVRVPQEDACQALGVPSALKYEADGGPGAADVMRLLLSSERPAEDRATFFRALVASWLLAGIDAHAKNYSVFLLPGGGLRLTPLYDLLSAYPVVARRGLARPKLKLAMAAVGRHRHYRWSEVHARHWLTTAEACALSAADARAQLAALAVRIEPAMAAVEAELPDGFPASVADPIFEGLAAMRAELERG